MGGASSAVVGVGGDFEVFGGPARRVRFTETGAVEGLTASIGSVDDAYDSAATETRIGLNENEAIVKHSPSRTLPSKGLPEVDEIVFD